MALNIADLFEHAVDAVPQRPVLQVGDRTLTYREIEADANRLAHFLSDHGVGAGDHVGLYAKNSIEYVVALLAVFKIRAVVINVNYRAVQGELDYLVDNSDMVALLVERSYADMVSAITPSHEVLRTVVVLTDLTDPGNDSDIGAFGGVLWAEALEGQSPDRDFDQRSGEDEYIVYTGGTTGPPKGVIWRHEDFWRVLCGGINFLTDERLGEFDQSEAAKSNLPMVTFPLSPLMHGGAQASLLMHLFAGQRTILVPRFDAEEAWRIIEREKVQLLFMTGDAMARPLIETKLAGSYDASSLSVIISGAAIFSKPVKEVWAREFPTAILIDSVGSSETGFQGTSITQPDDLGNEGPAIALGAESVLLDDDLRVIELSEVGAVGRLARTGSIPRGYYKDPERSAATFVEVQGVRYAVPGDLARVEPGGKVTLLGRGSSSINTGGEKVYPEEVESRVKAHPDVFDALVVGVPDETYGESVAVLVEPRPGRSIGLDEVRAFLKGDLAGYKLPRRIRLVEQIPRTASGKANYPMAAELASR